MPTFRKLTSQEVDQMGQLRKVDLTPYLDWLKDLPSGQGGEVTLEPGDNRRAVMRRLRKASVVLGKTIRFRQGTSVSKIVFDIYEE